jgi:hypothetical protein
MSLAAAALSIGGHVAVSVQPALAVEHRQAAQSCFTGVDFGRLSIGQLTVLVHKAVSDLRGMGKNDSEIVATIAAWMAMDARNCSAAQANALLRNVAAILKGYGFRLSSGQMASLLHSFFFKQPGAVAEQDIETRFPVVYGLAG